ncbi:winged helix-turn-helix domain-containing protein [Halorhabdus sp. CUG00001]|uniref:ArsR/SmtB family transcription factor n=1 Tax=Halorhabdus sp. CUG00001 TaxID=2600297 RepID=UPI00131EB08A|nr:winged helix-turn-helix domain-containing protein [Halorhabdus sp. CUG00001]
MGLTLTDAKRKVLTLLNEEPLHGYALAKELGKQGPTVYKHLQELEEAGYVKSEENGRRKVYTLTERGQLTLKADRVNE